MHKKVSRYGAYAKGVVITVRTTFFLVAIVAAVSLARCSTPPTSDQRTDLITESPTATVTVGNTATAMVSVAPDASNSSAPSISSIAAPTITLTALSLEDVSVPSLTISSDLNNVPSYDRDDWHHWIDADGDCQNTRHEVLIEESNPPVTFKDDRQCKVLGGQWLALFSAQSVVSASELDVDHMVPLANAHSSGGWAWSYERKKEYANNLTYEGHLIAVTASANRSKGAKGPEDWRPDNKDYWCQYAIDWIRIKATWDLTATSREWDALVAMLDSCAFDITIAGEVVIDPQPTVLITDEPIPSTLDTSRYDPFGPDRDCGDFEEWREAQAFFKAAGGPNNDPHRLDKDKDGIVCESIAGAP